MAGDYIIMRTGLATERATLLICDMTGLDEFSVIGRLHAVWSWAGEHTANGNVRSVTLRTVDRIARAEKFGDAMVAAGWLKPDEKDGISFPKWTLYNGKCAKKRANTALRQRKSREKKRDMRDGERDESVTDNAPTVHNNTTQNSTTSVGNTKAKRAASAFVPPTVEEVLAHCLERKNGIDPEAFIAYYETRGWRLKGGGKMQSWKSAIITWEKTRDQPPHGGHPGKPDLFQGLRDFVNQGES